MAQLQKYKDDFVLLLESGFIAASQTDEDAAVKLFRAAQILQPENVMPKVGFGYIHLLKLELNQACKKFEEVLKADPHNEMARAMLGLSTALTVKEADKGEKILEEALKKTKDPSVKNMASTAIEFVEKFVKKQPTPVQGQTKTQNKTQKKKGK
ncbi:MAG TPA: SctF chaperone SctG [Rhabdochlamydiaceae bacterium]|jgi:tetratricopeptide (TPR) repeat protein|nr:SctF chaperone SctG [Rhabdochlamydiaceae bacterium]